MKKLSENTCDLTSYVAENVTYYEPTLETAQFVKMSRKAVKDFIAQCIKEGNKGIAQGITEGVLSKAGV